MVDEAGDDDMIAIELDVTSAPQWEAAVDRRSSTDSGRSPRWSTAAGMLRRASLADETAEDFENAWRVNCLGAFLGMRAALEPTA